MIDGWVGLFTVMLCMIFVCCDIKIVSLGMVREYESFTLLYLHRSMSVIHEQQVNTDDTCIEWLIY